MKYLLLIGRDEEHVGGFYLIDVVDRSEAERWELRMPNVRHVEVRAVASYDA